jgi:hypothetical protein
MSKIEGAIYEGLANHFVGMESVGGKLYLTLEALIFVSHKLNIQVHTLEIPLREVTGLSLNRSLGLVPNGLTVHLASGAQEQFVVNKRKKWVEKINTLRNAGSVM